jgi:hypothetical protein
VANDLAISIIGYFGLVGILVVEILLVGRLMRGRGRMVVLALGAFLAGITAQVALLHDTAPLCLGDLCWRSFVRWIEFQANAVPWIPLWLGKFAAGILANSLFLLAGPLVVLTLAAATLSVKASEPLDDVEDRKDRLRRLLLGRSMRRLYGSLFWSAVGIGAAIVSLAAANPGSIVLRNVLDDLGMLVWAGPILGFGLLWGSSRAIRMENPVVAASVATEPKPYGRIEDLFNSYVAEYGDLLLFHCAVPAALTPEPKAVGAADSMIGRVMRAAQSLGYRQLDDMRRTLDGTLNKFWNEPEENGEKGCPIFEESLTFLHFIVFAELVLSCQDRGGCTLLLAPEASLDRFEEQLRRALSVHFAGYNQRIWRSDSQPQWIYDILIVSPERMESDLLSRERRNASIHDALERLSLVIVLDYQSIDASLLRIRLARLRRLIGKRALGVVCQSEPRAGVPSKIANTMSALIPVKPDRVEIAGRNSAERFWLFWRNDRTTLQKLLEIELGEGHHDNQSREIVPLTLVRAIRQAYDAVFFDPYGRTHRALWKEVLEPLRAPERMQRFLDAGWAKFPEEGDRVVVIEDLSNLVAAARMNLNFMHHEDCLIHIVSHNYPMRDFLLEVLRGEAEGVISRREGWRRIGEAYLPIAAHPTGGPTELAIDLATEFIRSRTGRVKQRDIEARFGEILKGGVAEARDIAPTKLGLQNLFQLQRDFTPEIKVYATPGHENEFEIDIQDQHLLEPSFLLPVVLETGIRITYVDQQDEGLTFLEGSKLQIRGYFYEVEHISDTQLTVRHAEIPKDDRPYYLFARQYVVHFEPRQTFLEAKEVPAADMQRLVHELRLLLRGSYDRRTVGMALADEISFDLPKGWERAAAQKASSNASIMLVRFALAEHHPQVAGLSADEFSRLAFTLAATLQDTLRGFFPAMGARLAVLSPQASPAIEAVIDVLEHGNVEDPDQLPINLYPRLIGEHHELAAREDDSPSDTERRLAQDLNRGPVPERLIRKVIDGYIRTLLSAPELGLQLSGVITDRLFAGEPNRVIDLIVVEDASHDRGAVRALFEDKNWGAVVAGWTKFVQWVADRNDKDDLYYRFGTHRVPGIFAFREAAEFLGAVDKRGPMQSREAQRA